MVCNVLSLSGGDYGETQVGIPIFQATGMEGGAGGKSQTEAFRCSAKFDSRPKAPQGHNLKILGLSVMKIGR
jgi:hypothetical protein